MSDPHYDREAEKYESPIPSREHILSFIQEKPRSKRQLFDLLALADEQKKAFERRLRAMVRDKQLSCNKSGVYRPFSNRGLLIGTVIANPKGFGFVALDKGGKDLRISSQHMANWIHHNICSEEQVLSVMKKMALIVDSQNKSDEKYIPMSLDFNLLIKFLTSLIAIGSIPARGSSRRI